MAAPTIAWGDTNLYKLPDASHLWGREFELLPSGTMFAAKSILHGLIGIEAKPLAGDRCQIRNGALLVIYGLGETEINELESYRDDVIAGFQQRQLQDVEAQG
jgi:hypothetical protein